MRISISNRLADYVQSQPDVTVMLALGMIGSVEGVLNIIAAERAGLHRRHVLDACDRRIAEIRGDADIQLAP